MSGQKSGWPSSVRAIRKRHPGKPIVQVRVIFESGAWLSFEGHVDDDEKTKAVDLIKKAIER